MFKKGVSKYHKGHAEFHAIKNALNGSKPFDSNSLERQIIRSQGTMSKNGKWAYIKLSAGQASILSDAMPVPETNTNHKNEESED